MFEIRFSIWAWNSVEEVNYWRVFIGGLINNFCIIVQILFSQILDFK